MATHFPQRPNSHQLEDESVQFFRRCLPRAWVCDEPNNDYGADLRVGIAEGGQLNGQALVAQLKATEEAPLGETVAIQLKISTLNYLRNLLEVALLVVYVRAEGEAYWLLLKDVSKPPDGQKTITVRIPRENRLSADPWEHISNYVKIVHYKKLGAMHATNGPIT